MDGWLVVSPFLPLFRVHAFHHLNDCMILFISCIGWKIKLAWCTATETLCQDLPHVILHHFLLFLYSDSTRCWYWDFVSGFATRHLAPFPAILVLRQYQVLIARILAGVESHSGIRLIQPYHWDKNHLPKKKTTGFLHFFYFTPLMGCEIILNHVNTNAIYI